MDASQTPPSSPQDDSQAQLPAQPASQSNDNGIATDLQVVSGVQVPDDASDADLIEKEWVIKAKDIVEHTQNNPHAQQKAISKFKADYMKKRYNKDIKTEDA